MVKPLRVTINSAGKSPHATQRQLILNAILGMKKGRQNGCSKHEIKRFIERYYNCKLGKKFMGQMGRSLNRLVKEAQLHNHYERYQLVPAKVQNFNSLGVRNKRPHCFCLKIRHRRMGKRRRRSRRRRTRRRKLKGRKPRRKRRGPGSSAGPRPRKRSRTPRRRKRAKKAVVTGQEG